MYDDTPQNQLMMAINVPEVVTAGNVVDPARDRGIVTKHPPQLVYALKRMIDAGGLNLHSKNTEMCLCQREACGGLFQLELA